MLADWSGAKGLELSSKEAGDSDCCGGSGAPTGVGLGAVLLAERGVWLTRGDEMARVGGRGCSEDQGGPPGME